jgi:hypothetical protein
MAQFGVWSRARGNVEGKMDGSHSSGVETEAGRTTKVTADIPNLIPNFRNKVSDPFMVSIVPGFLTFTVRNRNSFDGK